MSEKHNSVIAVMGYRYWQEFVPHHRLGWAWGLLVSATTKVAQTAGIQAYMHAYGGRYHQL
jgi:hypothetical protein